MRIMDKDKKPIRINIKDVSCIALRDFKEATVDIAITGVSKEFETDDGGVISFANLTSNQIRVINKDNECDYDILSNEGNRVSLLTIIFHFGHHR